MANFKERYDKFLKDIEENLKNKEDIEYVKTKLDKFIDIMVCELDIISEYKSQKIEEIEQKQKELENKMDKIQQIINHIEKDIYSDEGFDFEIICPYCDNEFMIDVDEERTEVECPICNNIIELDWTGEIDENIECDGICDGCHGCDELDMEQEDNDDNIQTNEDKNDNNDDDM